MIVIDICGSDAAIRAQQTLTCGRAGAAVQFRFDGSWEGLGRTAVFRAGSVTRDAAAITDTAVIPWEVLTTPGLCLEIGVYGTSADGKTVIPTVWAVTDPIQPGADPSGDPALEPENPVWQQAVARTAALEQEMDSTFGDVEQALDGILAIQNQLIGGDA